MGKFFLSREGNKKIEVNIDNFKKLIGYLKAMGNFKEDVKILKLWNKYFTNKGADEVGKIISSALEIAEIFEKKAKKELCSYTEKVNEFLILADEKYRYREDYISCRKKEVEYHLNMVEAEIMNNSYREELLKSKEKRLLLPSCMRLKNDDKCKSIKTEEGYMCSLYKIM